MESRLRGRKRSALFQFSLITAIALMLVSAVVLYGAVWLIIEKQVPPVKVVALIVLAVMAGLANVAKERFYAVRKARLLSINQASRFCSSSCPAPSPSSAQTDPKPGPDP